MKIKKAMMPEGLWRQKDEGLKSKPIKPEELKEIAESATGNMVLRVKRNENYGDGRNKRPEYLFTIENAQRAEEEHTSYAIAQTQEHLTETTQARVIIEEEIMPPRGYVLRKEYKNARLQLLIRPTTKKEIVTLAKKRGISINELLNQILDLYLASREEARR